jgi:hypothetical protein
MSRSEANAVGIAAGLASAVAAALALGVRLEPARRRKWGFPAVVITFFLAGVTAAALLR